MAPGLRDGLGGDNIQSSGVGALPQNPFFLGDVAATGKYQLAGGSPFGFGLTVPLTARTSISGGTFVSMSGGLAYAAGTSTKQPLGLSKPGTDVASGGTVEVILYGIAAVIAEGTIAVGAPAMMGAGAALNTVVAADASSGTRIFSTFDAGASGTTVFIRL